MSTQAPMQQTVIITKIEMIRFTLFLTCTMVSLLMQLQIYNQATMNSSLKSALFANVTNIFDKSVTQRFEILEWIDSNGNRLYNLNNFENDFLSNLIPLTNLTLQSQYIKIDGTTGVWNKNGELDQSYKGVFQQYKSPYQIQFTPWQVFIRRKTQADPVRDITTSSLKLFDLGYFDDSIKYLSIKAAYYAPDMQMLAIFKMQFTFTPAGLDYKSLQIDSFRINYYQSSEDITRMVFEILFSLIYINYLYMEGYKIYFKISQALKDDQNAQEALKKKEQRQKQKQKQLKGNQDIMSPKEEEEVKDLAKITEEKLRDAQRKSQIIVNTIINHIKDIWSALDVIILVILGIALSKYLNAVLSPSYDAQLSEVLGSSTSISQIFGKKNIIDDIATQADTLNLYRRLAAVALLIMWIKAVKYLIYSFDKLIQYLDILLNVVEYMVFYLILLSAVLMSFSLFIYFMYGSAVQEASSLYFALVYVLGFMFGTNDKFTEFYTYDETITFLLMLLFYLVVSIILSNMFFVFVKHEYNQYQNHLEEQYNNKKNQENEGAVNYQHPYWFFYNIAEYFIVRSWYTFTLRPKKFDDFMENKQLRHDIFQREFKENPQLIDFNIDFANLVNARVDDSEASKFLTQEEKERQINLSKMELIKLIWKTVLLLLILSLNFILIQQFYSPQDAFLQTDALQRKILYGTSPSFNSLNTKAELFDWLINSFDAVFDDNLFGKNELNMYAGLQTEQYNINTSLSKDEQIEQYELKEYAFSSLKRGYSLNTFNIVVNNIIRITMRRHNLLPNPDSRFLLISPNITLFRLENVLDNQDSVYENKSVFESDYSNYGYVQINYDETQGFKGKGGYVFFIEPNQISGLSRLLNDNGFFATVDSIVIEFITFNPGNLRGWAHTSIQFAMNQCGVIGEKIIQVTPIKKNSLQTIAELSILILSISLIIALTYYIYVTIKTMLHKRFSYNRWYNTYVLLAMNQSQLYFRERHMPGFIRESLFLMDISQLLNLLFLALMGAQISLILIYFFQVNQVVQASYIFQLPINQILKSTIFQQDKSLSNSDFFQSIQDIGDSQRLIGIFGSLAILVLCLEILYLVSHNKDFQMLTNSIKYTVSHLPFIFIVLFGFIISFSVMGHLVLGTEFTQFSTFFDSLIEFTDYILYIQDMNLYRKEDRILEFFLMIFPYVLTVRFIMINMFFSIALRGYLLSRTAQDKENESNKLPPLSLTAQEFVTLSFQMFTFKDKLQKVGSDQYLMQLIKQFEPQRIYSQMKENIRNQTNLTAQKAWAEECAKEIKEERELRKPLDVACNEILQSYIDLNNKGIFNVLQRLDSDQKRKMIEYSLKYTYLNYFRTSLDQLDKFNLFFSTRRAEMKNILFSDEKAEDHDKLVYIQSLEQQLEENIQSMTFIRAELLSLGFDIDIDWNFIENQRKEEINQVKKQKKAWQNPLASQLLSVLKQKEQAQGDNMDDEQSSQIENQEQQEQQQELGQQQEQKQQEQGPESEIVEPTIFTNKNKSLFGRFLNKQHQES